MLRKAVPRHYASKLLGRQETSAALVKRFVAQRVWAGSSIVTHASKSFATLGPACTHQNQSRSRPDNPLSYSLTHSLSLSLSVSLCLSLPQCVCVYVCVRVTQRPMPGS
jgi:hypothetical protein